MGEVFKETVLEQLSLYEDFDIELFFAFVELAGYDLLEKNIGEIFTKLTECFHGRYESKEEYATMLINECYKLPKFERKYFDYEAYCRDLFSTICYYDKKTKAVFSHNY